MFHNAREYHALYTEEDAAPVHYCAPRCEQGYEVEAVRQRIALRAGLAGSQSAGTLRGHVDEVTASTVKGWAQNADQPEAPVCIDIYMGGRLIGQALANRYREDLAKAGLGSGRHAFVFRTPPGVALVPDAVEVRRSHDGASLRSSQRSPQRAMPGLSRR
jgi:hypothetical protein